MTGRKYTCEHCRGTFTTTWSDEEANAESREIFGVEPTDETHAVICDDCFTRLRAWMAKREPAP